MEFYTPIFSKIVDSSLWSEPDFVVKVFLTMMAKKDRDQVVRGNAYNIASWSRKTEDEVMRALKILSSPDRRRMEPQPFEGRRIERVEDGWLILNGKHYQDLMASVNRRAYKAGYERQRRKKLKEGGVGGRYMEREKRFTKAHGDGDDALADGVAAEGVKPPLTGGGIED